MTSMAIIKRKVIKTKKASEAVSTEFVLTREDVEARSQRLDDPEWYAQARLEAWETYQRIPMPTLQDEAWRRTDIRALDWAALQKKSLAGAAGSTNGKVPDQLLKPLVGEAHGGQLVFHNGETASHSLDEQLKAQGVIFTDFRTATHEYADLLKQYLGAAVKVDDGKFSALAATMVQEGVFVYIPANTHVELPLHTVLWANQSVHFSRTVIVADEGASLTYVHELSSKENDQAALHVGTVEVFVATDADVKFIELQSLGQNFWHFSHERAQIGEDARFDWIFSAIGTHLTKNFSELNLVGDNAWGRMSGFYFAENDQHFDHDTQQNHRAFNTTSDLLFKGALRDKSRSVWRGMIYVAPGAQKTDGYQANRNLVLDKGARADSIPGLEILADDVRCTHASTVGQLEAEHIFYLMSRGLPYEEAKKLVVDGFFDPIMQRIPFEGVRTRMKETIIQKMG